MKLLLMQLEAIYHAGARAAQGAVSYVLRVPGISGALSFDDRAQAETAFEAATQRKL